MPAPGDGSFYIHRLARALARLPGRATIDEEEARHIADDIDEQYLRGEFSDDEVRAKVGDPPVLRSLTEIKEDARRRGESWQLSLPEFRAACYLTAPATLRLLRTCGYAGAPRLLRELFADARRPTDHEVKDWMLKHMKRGDKRDDVIRACMAAIGATSRQAGRVFTKLPAGLKLKRGQRVSPRKSGQ